MTYNFDSFEFDAERRTLTRGGEVVVLNAKALEILAVLVQRRGETLSKNELLELVWEGQIVEENNLTVQMSALRKALGERKGENRFLMTVPGKGYKFVGELSAPEETAIVIENRTIERITVDEVDDTPLALPAKSRRIAPFAIGGAVVLLIVAGLFFMLRPRPEKVVNSLAVLPFSNSNADTEYLSDGLAENVTFTLSQTPNLKVMSNGSVLRYKGAAVDAQKIGGELNVQAILVGRVTQRGDQFDVSAELISTVDNSVIWGERFSRKLADLEKIHSDIASSVSEKLRFKSSVATPRGTADGEAYRLYLQGLYQWNKRTPESIRKSIDLFEQSIALDPRFAQSYGARAVAIRVLGANGVFTKEETKALRAKTREAVKQALEIDENLVEARAVSGQMKVDDWDYAGAEREFQRAIAINPNYATAHQWYSELLALLGRYDEAMIEINKAFELEPFSRAVRMNIGLRHLEAGRPDDAIAQFDYLIANEPEYAMPYMIKSSAVADKGDLIGGAALACKALVLLKKVTDEHCSQELSALAEALKTGGEAAFWKKNLEFSLEYERKGIDDAVTVAAAYIRAGDKESALLKLDEAIRDHNPSVVYIRFSKPYTSLNDDPRYQEILKRIGF